MLLFLAKISSEDMVILLFKDSRKHYEKARLLEAILEYYFLIFRSGLNKE
jgi:hypothetical protein